MADIELLKRLAEAQPNKRWTRDEGRLPCRKSAERMYSVDGPIYQWDYEDHGLARAAASYIAAADPATVLALIAENEALEAESEQCREIAEQNFEAFSRMMAERDQLRAELERARADAELLRKHLAECADSLESEILDRYGSSKDHPAMRRKFECDMQDVIEARAAMGKGGRADA